MTEKTSFTHQHTGDITLDKQKLLIKNHTLENVKSDLDFTNTNLGQLHVIKRNGKIVTFHSKYGETIST